MHVLAILITLVIQTSLLRMDLGCLHNSLSGPEVDELLQLPNVILNSSLEKGAYVDVCLFSISSRMLVSTWQWSAVLKKKWKAFHKLSRERYGCCI